jgi:hypothetical protein
LQTQRYLRQTSADRDRFAASHQYVGVLTGGIDAVESKYSFDCPLGNIQPMFVQRTILIAPI